MVDTPYQSERYKNICFIKLRLISNEECKMMFIFCFISDSSFFIFSSSKKTSVAMKKKNIIFFFKLQIDIELVRRFVVHCLEFEPNVVFVDLVAKRNKMIILNKYVKDLFYLSFNTRKWYTFA
jgi:hypothetical protein